MVSNMGCGFRVSGSSFLRDGVTTMRFSRVLNKVYLYFLSSGGLFSRLAGDGWEELGFVVKLSRKRWLIDSLLEVLESIQKEAA